MTEQNNVGDTNRYYEIAFVVSPSVEEEEALAISEKIGEAVKKITGHTIDGEEPRLRKLAYPIYKVINGQKIAATTGYFGWNKFEIDGEVSGDAINSLDKELSSTQEILRYLLVKTIKEKTYTPQAPEEMEEEMAGEDVETIEAIVPEEAPVSDAEASEEGNVVAKEDEG